MCYSDMYRLLQLTLIVHLFDMRTASRLTSVVYSGGAGGLSRSASSAGERASGSYQSHALPKRAETFSGFDHAAGKLSSSHFKYTLACFSKICCFRIGYITKGYVIWKSSVWFDINTDYLKPLPF